MEKNHRLAVCILNWNGLAQTKQCITALQESTNKQFEIIILDNGSTTNEAVELTSCFGNTIKTYRSEKNLGFAGGYNYLILELLRQAPYQYYLLLNQDAIVHKNCIALLLNYLAQQPTVAVVGAKALEPDQQTIQSLGADINLKTGKIISRYKNKTTSHLTDPQLVDCVIGNCFLVRAAVINQIGLFDANYFAYYEEADWCQRAYQAGFTCAVIPQAIIYHNKISHFRTYLVVRNMIWFEKKFATSKQLLFFWCYFWCIFFPERIKKGSSLRELLAACKDGWLDLNKGQARFLK